MKETKFKTIMYCGMYVDVNKLDEGIYTCVKPYLYNMDVTIDTLIKDGRRIKAMTEISFISFISDNYFENLAKCKMVQLSVTEVDC